MSRPKRTILETIAFHEGTAVAIDYRTDPPTFNLLCKHGHGFTRNSLELLGGTWCPTCAGESAGEQPSPGPCLDALHAIVIRKAPHVNCAWSPEQHCSCWKKTYREMVATGGNDLWIYEMMVACLPHRCAPGACSCWIGEFEVMASSIREKRG